MQLYEVNLTISKAIAAEFQSWLPAHVEKVLATGCFNKANLFNNTKDDADSIRLVVQYYADSIEQIDLYCEQFSAEMRQEAIDKFGAENFQANRRFLQLAQAFDTA